jgi:hypothetical protein
MKAFLSCAAIAVALVASPAVAGQDARAGAPRASAFRGEEAPAAIQAGIPAFRGDLARVLDRYENVFRKLDNARGLRLVGETRESFAAMSDAFVARAFAKAGLPDLNAAVQAVEALDALIPERGAQSAADGGRTPGFPEAPPILGACDVIPHSSEVVMIALVAFQVVRTVLAIAEFTCLQTVVVLGEGGNTSLICVPFATVQDLAAIPYELADLCSGEEDSVLAKGSYDRLEHIHADIEEARAAIIANSNANRDIILAEMRNLSCDLMRVVHTPSGQRASTNRSCMGQPSFPFNWPELP